MAQIPAMLTEILPHNKTMASRTMETGSIFGGYQNSSMPEGGHGWINMMSAANVVNHLKDYGLSQPNLGKEPQPPEISLQIDKPEVVPHIPNGFLKHSRHNPNSRAS